MTIGPRVLVVGTSGAGKSRLAARLARALGGPHIELDEFQHGPGWSQRSVEELRERTAAAIAGRDERGGPGPQQVSDVAVVAIGDPDVWLDDRTLGRVFRRSRADGGGDRRRRSGRAICMVTRRRSDRRERRRSPSERAATSRSPAGR